jgi:hypothetical protein
VTEGTRLGPDVGEDDEMVEAGVGKDSVIVPAM